MYTGYKLYLAIQKDWQQKRDRRDDSGTMRLDSALPPSDAVNDVNRKVVKHDEDGREIVATGNSVVPEFPRTITLPNFSAAKPETQETDIPSVTSPTLVVLPGLDAETEYTLVGLGTRSVSFLGINVYVLGYYIATQDIADLQAKLIKKVNPIASTLISTEKNELRAKLLDPVEGEAIWEELLQSGIPARSCVRVVPVRDTDFPHLRDGFVRAIQANSDKMQDDQFGEAMKQFKQLFQRGKVPKRKQLLMLRNKSGRLTVAFDEGTTKDENLQLIGNVDDERISRALWMNYLGGKTVASEEARKNIVEGVMEFVERPVGTVAAQVV